MHSRFGPGLLESVYEAILAYDLENRGLHVRRQVPIPIVYEDIAIGEGFRADLMIEGKVLIELKSVDQIAPVHKKQLLTYLRLCGMHLGLLLNFHVNLMKEGFHRVVDNLT